MQVDAIQQVIQRADAEQVQALASGDPSVMADTATADHLNELRSANQDLTAGGAQDIHLDKLEWGPVSVNGNSASATVYETWTVHYKDSSTETSRDTNEYTLVLENGAWKVSADEHPDNNASTTPVAPVAPVAPSAPSVPNQTPMPSIPGGSFPFPFPFVIVPGGPQPSVPQSRSPQPSVPQSRSPQPSVPQTVPTQPRTSPRPGSTPSQDTSHNWSGYASTDGKFTSVSGTWTVPQVKSNGAQGMGATWVGIGGVNSRDLIQAGTEETDMGNGQVEYSAWVEMLPAASQPIRFGVHPGDSITVDIGEQSTNNWQIAFKNNTTGQEYKTNKRYTSTHSSAEWVVEAPSSGMSGQILPLDNFDTVSFTSASATENGQSVDLTNSHAQPITMLGNTGQALAVPSSIGSDGNSFSVARTDAPASSPSTARSSRGGRGSASAFPSPYGNGSWANAPLS
jgi:hypothetical protein